ncbi:TetR/AcrR family transcriptional regulator [Nocardia sp. NPDC059240]|uniref:TetR/AcrR family transcriptional regulator n=1 Tax=Nocardia sp. NPDC059240 TaxID=3346786 RepID=UPI00369F8ABC
MTEARVRRTPRQSRSLERVQRIQAAALTLVQEGGVDAVTTTAIAERAEVSVATLYQFFANRDAVLEALIGGQIEILDRRMAEELTTTGRPDTIAAAVETFIAIHNAHYLEHPQFVALYYKGRARSSGLNKDAHTHLTRIADMLYTGLISTGLLPRDTDRRVVEVAVELGDRIFEMAYRDHPTGDEQIIAEGTLALTRYLEAHR